MIFNWLFQLHLTCISKGNFQIRLGIEAEGNFQVGIRTLAYLHRCIWWLVQGVM